MRTRLHAIPMTKYGRTVADVSQVKNVCTAPSAPNISVNTLLMESTIVTAGVVSLPPSSKYIQNSIKYAIKQENNTKTEKQYTS